MSTVPIVDEDRLVFSQEELLSSDGYASPLIADRVRCHGGFDTAGQYRAQRTLHRDPAIRAWAPRLRTEGLVYSSRASAGSRVVGVDPAREADLSLLESSVISGEYFGSKKRRALLGADLAERLRVETGDKIVLSIQDESGEMVSELFRIGGLFRTPLPELDQATVFVRLSELQPILGVEGEISETAIRADPKTDLAALAERVRAAAGAGTETHTWDELRPILVFLVAFFEAQAGAMYGAVFIAMLFGIANVDRYTASIGVDFEI